MAAVEKGTLLWVPFQETSAFHACFSLLRRCREAGFRCVVVVFDKFAPYIEGHGFETAVIDVNALEAATQATGKARLFELDAHVSRRFAEIVAQSKASLVLLDQMLWWRAPLVARANIPLLMLCNTYASSFNSLMPPVCSPQQPKSGLIGQIHHCWAWLRLALWPLADCNNETLWSLWFSAWFRRQRKAVETAGLALEWGEYGYRIKGDELVLAPRVLDFESARAQRHYAGACLDVERDEMQRLGSGDGAGLMPELDQRPLIYVSFGSYRFFKGRARAYRCLLEWMAQRKDLQMVMHIHDEEAKDLTIPEHVHTMAWAPQLQLLQKAALFVTHGGLSSVKEACYFGKPMLVVPFFNDGFGNGARVVQHGLGHMLGYRDLSVASIEASIGDILGTERVLKQCQDLRDGLLNELSCQAGLDVIREQNHRG